MHKKILLNSYAHKSQIFTLRLCYNSVSTVGLVYSSTKQVTLSLYKKGAKLSSSVQERQYTQRCSQFGKEATEIC